MPASVGRVTLSRQMEHGTGGEPLHRSSEQVVAHVELVKLEVAVPACSGEVVEVSGAEIVDGEH